MKKVHLLLLTVLFGSLMSQNVKAQDKLYRNVFHGSPKLQGGIMMGATYPLLFTFLVAQDGGEVLEALAEGSSEYEVLRWALPTGEMGFHIPSWSLSQNGMDIALQKPDWWTLIYPDMIHNYEMSVGYEFSWKSLQMPLGAYAGFDFNWRQVCIKEGMLAGKHRFTAFVPSAGVRIRLLGNGFERKHNWNVILDAGGGYNLPIKYKNFYGWGPDALGKGFRSKIGIVFSSLDFGAFYVRWERDLYNVFNEEFSSFNGVKPFAGLRSNFNSVMFGWTLFI